MKIFLYKAYRNIATSLWLIPVLCVLIGMAISFITLAVDRANDYQLVPPDLVGGPEAAMAVLTTVAASMVNLAVLVLTIVLVVVQLAMGQFSPRIVQRLLRDRPSQFAIGLFVATFVHTLLAIREVDPGGPNGQGQVPGAAIIVTFVLALVSIAVLVMYIHHIGQALRVSALVEIAGDDTRKLIDQEYPPPDDTPVDPTYVTADKSGVVTTIAHNQLIREARAADCVLEMLPALGEFVPAGGRLFQVHGDPNRLDRRSVANAVILQLERTLEHDVAYGIRLLVDMAIRALSDAPWQDPTTAVQAIDRIHDCLRELVRRPFPDGRHYDHEGELRLVERTMSWDDYVHLAFAELRLAGAASPQVARRLQAALQDLRRISPFHRQAVLDEQLELLNEAVAGSFGDSRDIELARYPDPSGLGAGAGVAEKS
jgi:uncharacterized membrane protein